MVTVLDLDNLKKRVGQRISHYRSRRGLTQEQLAVLVDIEPNSVSRIELGNQWASPEKLEGIAKALGVSVAALFAPSDPVAHVSISDVLELLSKALESDVKRKLLEHLAVISDEKARELLDRLLDTVKKI